MTTGATKPPKGGFVIFAYWDSMTTQRAIAYIDGYNLYYSRLQGTAYKWLDWLRCSAIKF